MKHYKVEHFAQLPNNYVAIERSRICSSLEEKLITLAVIEMQNRYRDCSRSTDFDWSYIASNTVSLNWFIMNMQITNNSLHIKHSISNLSMLGMRFTYWKFNQTTKQENLITDFVPLFQKFELNHTNNTLTYVFNEYFQRFFTEITNHFQLSIDEIVSFNSIYAIRLYSLFKSKLNMDKTEYEYSLPELKKYLNIDKKYQQYGHFKNKVLDIAIKYINTSPSSKFFLDYIEKKGKGKKIAAVVFNITSKGEKYYDLAQKTPNYKKNRLYRKFEKLTKHEDVIIAGAATQIILLFDEIKQVDLEQTICKLNFDVINKRLEILKQKNLK